MTVYAIKWCWALSPCLSVTQQCYSMTHPLIAYTGTLARQAPNYTTTWGGPKTGLTPQIAYKSNPN